MVTNFDAFVINCFALAPKPLLKVSSQPEISKGNAALKLMVKTLSKSG